MFGNQGRNNCPPGGFGSEPSNITISQSFGQDAHYSPMANMYDGFQTNSGQMKPYAGSIGNDSNFLANTDNSSASRMNTQGIFNVEGTTGYPTMQSQNYSYDTTGYGMVGQENTPSHNRSFPIQTPVNDTFDQNKSIGYNTTNSETIPGKNMGYPMGPGPIGSRRVSAPAGLSQRNFQQRSTSFTQDISFPATDMNSGFTSDQQVMNSITHRNYQSGPYHPIPMQQSNMYPSIDLPMVSEGNMQQNYQQKYPASSYPNSNIAMRGQKSLNYGMSRSVYQSGSSGTLTRTTSRPSIQRSFSAGRADDNYNKLTPGHVMPSASFELNRGFMNGTEFGNMQMKGDTTNNRISSVNMSSNLMDSVVPQLGNSGAHDSPMSRLATQRLRHYGPSPANPNMNFGVQGIHSTSFSNRGFNPMQSTSGNTSNFESNMPNAMQNISPSSSGTMNLDNMAMVNQADNSGFINTASAYPNTDNFNIPQSQQYQNKADTYGSGLPNMNGTDLMSAYDPNMNPMSMGKINSSNPMQFQSQTTHRHARTDRIFSQELEKLAKLSRNPMSEPFNASSIIPAIDPSINPQINTFTGNAESIASPNNLPKTSISPAFQTDPLPQPPSQPDDTFIPNTQINSTTSKLKPIQSLPTTTNYSAPSTPNNQTDTPVSSSSVNKTQAQPNFAMNVAGKSPTEFTESKIETEDRQNAVQHLKRLTNTIKDKKSDTKNQKGDYISHGNTEGNVEGGSQNCIAALSAACRNMIADMDNEMPKQKSTNNQGQANNTLPGFDGLAGGNSTPNFQNNIGMTQNNSNVPNNTAFNNNQYNLNSEYMCSSFSGGTNHYMGMGVDFQMQYHDFLEQSLPMQMTHKRPDEKPKRTRRRKVSEDISDQISSTNVQKRRRSRKKSQNPPSVDSIGTPQSIDTCATSALSDNFLDDITNNGSTSMQSISFGSLNSHTPSPNCVNSKTSPCTDNLSGHFLDSDNFESVFSPDTTAQSLPQSTDDVTNSSLAVNTSTNSSKPSTPNRPSSNYSSSSLPIVSPKSGNSQIAPQPSSLPTSTSSEFNSSQVSENAMQTQEGNENEAHPLEILQQQIQLQRQQFNLGETGSIAPAKDSTNSKNTNNTNHSQSDLNVEALITDKNSAWYLTNDTKKDEVVLPWEDSKKTPSTMSTKGRRLQSLMCIS